MSSRYHPKTNGQTERLNQELETGLCCLTSRDPSGWSKLLLWVEYAHNTLPSSSNGLSPFQCVFGFKRPLFPETEPEVNVPSAAVWSVAVVECGPDPSQLSLGHQRQKGRRWIRGDKQQPVYRPGQKFWLSTRNLPLQTESRKLTQRFIGQFPVLKIFNPSVVRLKLPRTFQVQPSFLVSNVKPVKESTLVPPSKPRPPPPIIDGDPV